MVTVMVGIIQVLKQIKSCFRHHHRRRRRHHHHQCSRGRGLLTLHKVGSTCCGRWASWESLLRQQWQQSGRAGWSTCTFSTTVMQAKRLQSCTGEGRRLRMTRWKRSGLRLRRAEACAWCRTNEKGGRRDQQQQWSSVL